MNAQWQKAIDFVVEEVRGTARFRWLALITAWIVCVAGWAVVAMQKNVYRADARVYLDARTPLTPVLQGLTINQDINAQLSLVAQSMMSDAQLGKLAHEVGLDRNVSTPQERTSMLADVRSSIDLGATSNGVGMVYTLAYNSFERETSLKAVQFLIDSFVSGTLGGKRADSEAAESFLKQQVAEYEKRLREAEQRLADFKRRNVGQMPGLQGDYFTRLQSAMNDVDTLKSSLAVAITQRDALQRQLAGSVDLSAPETAPALDLDTPTSRAMKDAEDKLQELTLKYTDKHPDVVATRETLAQLKLRRDEEIAALRRGSPSVAVSSTANPVVQKMQVSLNEAEVEIAGLRSKLADKERTVDSLRAMVNIVPEVEVEYARLNRDYDFTRSQYNEFVARLDKTNLGQEAESAESIKFEVIKPPSAGMKPVRPNRPLLMTAVLLVSLVVGCGLAYLLHVLRPVFHSDQALQGFTGFPVLGVVAMTWLERYRQRRIRSYAGYALAVLGLFVALLIVLQLQQWMPLSLSRS